MKLKTIVAMLLAASSNVVLACSPAPARSAGTAAAEPDEVIWEAGPDLPRPVSNNAVVGLDFNGAGQVYSFLGLSSNKQWDGVVNWAFRWTVGENVWEELPPVPGPGRLAGTAEAWGGKIYVFGGYTVAEDGGERSVPDVNVFDPATDSWSVAAPMPVPVDDAVSGVWRDSLIVLVSGWHDTDNVADVQLYDPVSDAWTASTDIAGAPVFGHAGKVAQDAVVYLGGANTRGTRPRYQIESSAWIGAFEPTDPAMIEWRQLGPHPGPPLYRAASAAVEDWILFAGGTDNPYNYTGIGYDGVPADALSRVFAFHVPTAQWVESSVLPAPRMDHRALAVAGGRVVLVGGLDGDRSVTASVMSVPVERLVEHLANPGAR